MNLGLELNDKWLTLASESKASQEGRADIPSSDITQGDLSHKWIRVPAAPRPTPNCDIPTPTGHAPSQGEFPEVVNPRHLRSRGSPNTADAGQPAQRPASRSRP